jgi:hypothetical protein
MSATEVHNASRDAAVGKVDMHHEAHGAVAPFHRSGQDENWPAWYAAYMMAEQAGTDMPA